MITTEDLKNMKQFIEVTDRRTNDERRLLLNLDSVTYVHLDPYKRNGSSIYSIRLRDENDIYVSSGDLKRILDALNK